MDRYVDMNEISDGKLYDKNDLVKADCGDCAGCSYCCENMTDTIILDPLDLYQLSKGLKKTVAEMIGKELDLGVVDGIVLPHIRMTEERGCCPWLNIQGRCDVHGYRPGFCRLFPLGRFYENRSFRYFLQTKECKKTEHAKVKVKKWIGMPEFDRYEAFLSNWHYLLKDLQKPVTEGSPEFAKQISMLILQLFLLTPYDTEQDFYPQYEARVQKFKEYLSSAGIM